LPDETRQKNAVALRNEAGFGAARFVAQAARPAVGSGLADDLAFLRGFIARPMEVASVVPSSTFLATRVVQAAGLACSRCVVELGPGTGPMTRALLRALAPDARLLAIELNPAFCARLRRRIGDPRLAVQEGSAEDLAEHLAHWGLPAPDAVISGIPFSTLEAAIARRVAAAVHANLAPGGRFVAYQLRPHVAACAAPLLGTPEVAWEWRNVPPMRVFRWQKPTA
jgi:phospholipid N-methyltransferase